MDFSFSHTCRLCLSLIRSHTNVSRRSVEPFFHHHAILSVLYTPCLRYDEQNQFKLFMEIYSCNSHTHTNIYNFIYIKDVRYVDRLGFTCWGMLVFFTGWLSGTSPKCMWGKWAHYIHKQHTYKTHINLCYNPTKFFTPNLSYICFSKKPDFSKSLYKQVHTHREIKP